MHGELGEEEWLVTGFSTRVNSSKDPGAVLGIRSPRHSWALTYLLTVTLLALLAANTSHAAVMRGLLVYGHEARTFQPCGEPRTLWVSAPRLHRQLQIEYRNLAKTSYAAVFVEIEDEFIGQGVGEFARDYDGSIEVRELRLISREGVEACRAERPTAPARSPAVSSARTYVFVCDNQSTYTVRATATEAWIFRPEGALRLPAVPTETGAKYASEIFEISILGEQAQLGEPTGEQQSCHNDRRRAIWEHAKLDGADSAVDIYRDDALIAVAEANDGAYRGLLGKVKGTFVYQVCETGTASCSEPVSVTP